MRSTSPPHEDCCNRPAHNYIVIYGEPSKATPTPRAREQPRLIMFGKLMPLVPHKCLGDGCEVILTRPGKEYCPTCLKKRKHELYKKHRDERLAAKLCVRGCGRTPEEGYLTCRTCIEKFCKEIPLRFCVDCGVAIGQGVHRCLSCKKSHEPVKRILDGNDDGRKRSAKVRLVGPFVCQNPFCGKDFYYRPKPGLPNERRLYCSYDCSNTARIHA